MAVEHSPNLRVLMFPHLAYGHFTPIIEVAKSLTDRGFSIELCSTPITLSLIKKKIPHKYSCSIHLVELHLPDLPELPPQYHTTNGLPVHLGPVLFNALAMSEPQFYQILKDQKPHVLIFDVLLPWAVKVASSLNIPAIKFCAESGASSCYYGHRFIKPGAEFPFPALYLKDYEKEIERYIVNKVEEEEEGERIMLLNSSRAIDGKYMDYLSEIGHTNILPTGVAIQFQDVEDMEETELTKWLGKKNEHSTVYVSFGSECILKKKEIEELAYGLELSDVHFVWVVRYQGGEQVVNLEEALPRGFRERIGERGRIVEGWAPQARILKHPSIGAFVTHCGWNSTLESIMFGVPIIALPMNFCSDQSVNARMVVEKGIAVEMARDGNGKLHRVNIAETLKNVICGGKIGEDLRGKVKSLGENIRLLRDEEADKVAEVIKQVYEKNQSKNALT
ncbi:beta-D-glucosyl crocetin beta-1,6-glucosyltransferase [Capsicum annuum]|uniref:beta-D-glucosyl crocetin beta-1,6-glucosyltransferase n=1 Tax=Capsicum annuum TaxID=4072 RepID=UPI001FB0A31A|nr:beta-D-glucosyl crocetin beta-1,6-glucosyltransferase [Capsicum annuum]